MLQPGMMSTYDDVMHAVCSAGTHHEEQAVGNWMTNLVT